VPESAEQIIDAKADYLLAVKENQPSLYAEMEIFFDKKFLICFIKKQTKDMAVLRREKYDQRDKKLARL
jgi:hypothetical protein